MADFPCLPLWTDAYMADTGHLTAEEHGSYLLLLIEAWRSADCSLPDDDALLARHAKLTPAKWRASKPIIMAFWRLDKRRGRWTQKRLKKERQKVAGKKRAARDSAASRWKQTKSGHAGGMRTQCSPTPTPSSKAKAFSGRASAQKPHGFVEVRKTTHAINDLIKEIRNDAERIGIGSEGHGSDVPMLPAIRVGRS